MGDMADWFIEQEMNANPHRSFSGGHRRGNKYRLPLYQQSPVHICKTCGKGGLIWSNAGNRYKLVNADYTPHVCNPVDVQRRAASDFKDCDE